MDSADLFTQPTPESCDDRPLADRMRPQIAEGVFGQEEALGVNAPLRRALESDAPCPSFILWGPPGCGKTTIARLFAHKKKARFVALSAIDAGAADLRHAFKTAEKFRSSGERTLLLTDEIHRFNKAQQDLFLPYIENGTIILIGATTENPSFALNSALLSRCRVVTLKKLDHAASLKLLDAAETFVGKTLPLSRASRDSLAAMADGDGRYLIGLCEAIFQLDAQETLDEDALSQIAAKRFTGHDKGGDAHYNLLSVFHKSLRGSDADAALYWAARIIAAGEDPLTVIRRLCACAAEDVGTADPQALIQALAAKDAYRFLGWPEGRQALAQAIIYVACCPKSNAAYKAFDAAMADAKKEGAHAPPMHALNAPTSLMKKEGYGKGYVYDHDAEHGYAGLSYFPSETPRRAYYNPTNRGFERDLRKRLDFFATKRR